MKRLGLWTIFVFFGCGASVTASRTEAREADAGSVADSSSVLETSVTEPDAPVVAKDAKVETDDGIVADASAETDAVVAEEDAVVAEDAIVIEDASGADTAIIEDAGVVEEDVATTEDAVIVPDSGMVDASVDAMPECHSDPRFARPLTIVWGDGSERPNLFYLTVEVPAGFVPTTLHINLPIRQNNGTFAPATARFDVGDVGLRCAVLLGQRIFLRVPLDFGDRPENGRYVNYVLEAYAAARPETTGRFTSSGLSEASRSFVIARDQWGTDIIRLTYLRIALIIEADGNYYQAIQLPYAGPSPEITKIIDWIARAPYAVSETTVRNLSYRYVYPEERFAPHVENYSTVSVLPSYVEEEIRMFRAGVGSIALSSQIMHVGVDYLSFYTVQYESISSVDGGRRMRRAAEYNAVEGRCMDYGLVRVYEDATRSVSTPFEFIPVTVPPATTPECFVHIIGLVCPPGYPLLPDGHCGPPRS